MQESDIDLDPVHMRIGQPTPPVVKDIPRLEQVPKQYSRSPAMPDVMNTNVHYRTTSSSVYEQPNFTVPPPGPSPIYSTGGLPHSNPPEVSINYEPWTYVPTLGTPGLFHRACQFLVVNNSLSIIRVLVKLDCHLDSLNDSDMEWAIYQGHRKTLQQASILAHEYEAFRTGRSRRNVPSGKICSQSIQNDMSKSLNSAPNTKKHPLNKDLQVSKIIKELENRGLISPHTPTPRNRPKGTNYRLTPQEKTIVLVMQVKPFLASAITVKGKVIGLMIAENWLEKYLTQMPENRLSGHTKAGSLLKLHILLVKCP